MSDEPTGSGSDEQNALAATEMLQQRPPLAARLGRYRIQRLLGEGGFGRVYLAFDEELFRQVAIKVPTPDRFHEPEDAEEYLAEARTVAGLDHPHIVPVYDVGRAPDGTIYVVSKFIEGCTFRDRLESNRPGSEEAARLLATIATALDYAHRHRLIHRDIKPANLLIEEATGSAYIADFGLAIRDDDCLAQSVVSGTPAYMSPEQARGEGHRLDGRSDIYSLGVVLYETLTGRRPFQGTGPSDILKQLVAVEPPDPRELEASIPQELERICLKAMSKRAADRYATAAEMAEDLLAWQAVEATPKLETVVVPKGLRSFDADDAEFFLELLPGPRDRTGLPSSLHFWKSRIEERDADRTFRVGLIFGPSGCGKSSLVKAGLLPRLNKNVIAVCVDATSNDTEWRIARALRKRIPELRGDAGLVETFTAIRRSNGPKVVVVIDQFEQWLHAHRTEHDSALVVALRQCDGGRLQAVVMVRDDFSMAASRFMRQVETPIVEGQNFATVDLFDVEHAQKVLVKFGQALGRLPRSDRPTEKELAFVRLAAHDLARDGKVVSVRLALFAEMVKDRPWEPATLSQLGGTQGIGVKFLEEKFNGREANPDHRQHQQAARDILQALLPDVGTDIKGHMRSITELQSVVRREDQPNHFSDLIRILDSELRLITPTDPASENSNVGAETTYYQLTHDYLVPALRQWLTQKQQETARGRAELRLIERATFWVARPENRHLPSLFEYVRIVALTSPDCWTPPQRQMMATARRVYRTRAAAALAMAILCAAASGVVWQGVVERQNRLLAQSVVDQLLVADVSGWPTLATAAQERAELTRPWLEAAASSTSRPESERLRAAYALADEPGVWARQLISFAATAELPVLHAIRDRMKPVGAALKDDLWEATRQQGMSPTSQLRLAALLATADPDGSQWTMLAPPIVAAMLHEKPLEMSAPAPDRSADLEVWAELLRPAAKQVIPQLHAVFLNRAAADSERTNAARVLARYADAPLMAELLLEADSKQFATLMVFVPRLQDAVVQETKKALGSWDKGSRPDLDQEARRRRNAALVLLQCQAPEAERMFVTSSDNTVRTMLMAELRDFKIPPQCLVQAVRDWTEPTARQALVIGLGPYRGQELTSSLEQSMAEWAIDTMRHSPHQSERSAAQWLLVQWERRDLMESIEEKLAVASAPTLPQLADRDWWVTSERQAMFVVRRPAGRAILRPFAVSICEVTIEQYRRCFSQADFAEDVDGDKPRSPANQVSYQNAIRYCRWLSEQEGLREDQMCYDADAEPTHGRIQESRLMRCGYRLPTETEWELVCRAGSTTNWFCGNRGEDLSRFGWILANSDAMRPVGTAWPNGNGMFDMAGNVTEWCHGKAVVCGGAYNSAARRNRSDSRQDQSLNGYSFTGFRIARTMLER